MFVLICLNKYFAKVSVWKGIYIVCVVSPRSSMLMIAWWKLFEWQNGWYKYVKPRRLKEFGDQGFTLVLDNPPCPVVGSCVCWSVDRFVFRYIRDHSLLFSNFGPQVYLKGSYLINPVCQLVSLYISLYILEIAY